MVFLYLWFGVDGWFELWTGALEDKQVVLSLAND
jgi:hypothetical protein